MHTIILAARACMLPGTEVVGVRLGNSDLKLITSQTFQQSIPKWRFLEPQPDAVMHLQENKEERGTQHPLRPLGCTCPTWISAQAPVLMQITRTCSFSDGRPGPPLPHNLQLASGLPMELKCNISQRMPPLPPRPFLRRAADLRTPLSSSGVKGWESLTLPQ